MKITPYEELIGYGNLDPVKCAALAAAMQTAGNIAGTGWETVPLSYGESVFLIEHLEMFIGMTIEGLGTKERVADALRHLMLMAHKVKRETGKTYYDQIAQCTIAMILNDMATLGIDSLILMMHWAVGDSKWFKDEQRTSDLIAGTKKTCDIAGCVWGGGETPTLRKLIYGRQIVLSGAATGHAAPKSRLIRPNIQAGDAIFMLPSPGIMANGLSGAAEIAKALPNGYMTELSDGRMFGEALLTPTTLFGPVIRDMITAGVDIHYTVNVTGHGARKFMRSPASFTYVIEKVDDPYPEFQLIQETGGLSTRSMFETYNMNWGFGIYANSSQGPTIRDIASKHNLTADKIGYIENGPRRVVVEPLGLEWEAEALALR